MIRVVSGALFDSENRVLMGRRKASGYRPDLWELPGGKIEEGELSQTALEREWMEECGCVVRTGSLISGAVLHLDISFIIELYEVKLAAPEFGPNAPQAIDHQALRWVDPYEAVKFMPCSPAFYLHFPQLREFIRSVV